MGKMLAIGLMSGTSADGIDGVVLDMSQPQHYRILKTAHSDYPQIVRDKIKHLITQKITHASQSDGLDNQLAHLYAQVVRQLIDGLEKNDITVVGSHGQTINHSPNSNPAFSLQIGDGQSLANLIELPVVSDFRAADIAAGGQGAPLTPGFHQAVFASAQETRAIVNIGGIANVTILSPDNDLIGFDTGTGNTLIDQYCQQHYNQPYDDAGHLARQGKTIQSLLDACLSDPYFSLPFPKSTGLEYFNVDWLATYLQKSTQHTYSPKDLLATLTVLTAKTITDAIDHFGVSQIYLCGGGAKNDYLLSLVAEFSGVNTQTTDTIGIEPQWVEAAAFAWMAKRTLERQPSTIPSVTGASKPTVAGKLLHPENTFGDMI